MPNDRSLSVLGSTALCLTLSTALAGVFLGWLATAKPSSLGARFSGQMAGLIGHSGRCWFLFCYAGLTPPAAVIIIVLACSRFRGVLLRVSGIASLLAMLVSYWPWRRHNLGDGLLVFVAAMMVLLTFMHARGWTRGRRWAGLLVLFVYYGTFAWLFNRELSVPEVEQIPASGLVSMPLWARGIAATRPVTRNSPSA